MATGTRHPCISNATTSMWRLTQRQENLAWTAVAHLALDGAAKKLNGTWLFLHSTAPLVGVPIP
jgi:hypothetical protein